MSLLKMVKINNSSGRHLDWELDSEALSDDDIKAAAFMIRPYLFSFAKVYSADDKSNRFAQALAEYADARSCSILIAQDILNTGRSIERKRVEIVEGFMRDKNQMRQVRGKEELLLNVQGVVMFCRGQVLPRWVTPLFYINGLTKLNKTTSQVKINAPKRKAFYV